MAEHWRIEDGVVTGRIHGVVDASERERQVSQMETEISLAQARGVKPLTPTAEESKILSMGPRARRMVPGAMPGNPFAIRPEKLSIDPKRAAGIELDAMINRVASLREVVDTADHLDVGVYAESEVGAPLAWPRAYRARLLAETDYADLPGWRSGKAPEVLTAADAYRAALRDLPKTCPDPASVAWPAKPPGL